MTEQHVCIICPGNLEVNQRTVFSSLGLFWKNDPMSKKKSSVLLKDREIMSMLQKMTTGPGAISH